MSVLENIRLFTLGTKKPELVEIIDLGTMRRNVKLDRRGTFARGNGNGRNAKGSSSLVSNGSDSYSKVAQSVSEVKLSGNGENKSMIIYGGNSTKSIKLEESVTTLGGSAGGNLSENLSFGKAGGFGIGSGHASGKGYGDLDLSDDGYGGTVGKNIDTVRFIIFNKIKQSLKYPYIARKNGWEGKVVVRIYLEDGIVKGYDVLKSSGYKVLDEEVIRALSDIKRMELKGKLLITVPVVFKLRDKD